MPEREKVIEGLQKIIADDWIWKHADYYASLISDAVELLEKQEAAYQGAEELLRQKTILFDDAIKRLKEQEAVEPLFNERMKHFVCRNCSLVLDEGRDNYCPSCGKRIAWVEYYIHEDETERR